jgi:hypothetical protein
MAPTVTADVTPKTATGPRGILDLVGFMVVALLAVCHLWMGQTGASKETVCAYTVSGNRRTIATERDEREI